MKKLTAVLLAALILTMTACGGSSAAPEPTAAPAAENTQPYAEEPVEEPAEEPIEEPVEEPAEEPVEEPAPEAPDDDLMGEWDGRTYRNAYLGVTYRQPESWSHLEREQLLQLSGLAAEQIQDEELSKRIVEAGEKGVTIYVMYASAPGGSASCNLVLENLNALAALAVSEESYIDIAMPQLETALTSAGMTDLAMEKGAVSLAGAEHPCVFITGTVNGTSMAETIIVQKQDAYIACYSVAAPKQEDVDQIIAAWAPLEG